MSILRDFEKRLEGAVEGFFARAFRSGLQPIELAKALQRYAANYQQVGVDGVFVPNVYRFTLAPEDLERFSGFTKSLQRELADVARRSADEKGWRTQGPIRIEFERSPEVRVGTYELRGKSEARSPVPATPRATAVIGATIERVPTTRAAVSDRAELRIDEGADSGGRHAIHRLAILGRLPECEVVLTDASVSRKHARVQLEGDRWTVTDLGSTNGVKVNGTRVGTAEVRSGDRLEFGNVGMTFTLLPDGSP